MSERAKSGKEGAREMLDRLFIEHRAKLIDLAALLDRVDRAGGGERGAEDVRVTAIRKAAAILADGRPERARRILELMSDPSREPIAAAGMKGATGVWAGLADVKSAAGGGAEPGDAA